jgi:hypothetical protein
VIATVNSNGLHSGASEGSTTTSTCSKNDMTVWENFDHCPLEPVCPDAGTVNTVELVVHHPNPYIFVGSDPGLQTPNGFTTDVSPTGGTLAATSSDSHDTFTYESIGGTPSATISTSDQSQSNLDRTLTFTYTASGMAPVHQTLVVTARQFAYAANNTPGNTCSLGYGTYFSYVYTPFTHPDKAAVQPSIGLSGTAVTESFSPAPPAGAQTGNGDLDQNSQFSDTIAYCSNAPLTASTSVTQKISIAGYQVRQNLLTCSSSGVALTNQGPTQ